jgi:hypothetical protein
MESARGGETPPKHLSLSNYMYIRYLFETQVSQYPYAELLSTLRAKVMRRNSVFGLCEIFTKATIASAQRTQLLFLNCTV